MLSSSDNVIAVVARRGDDAPPVPRPVYTSPPRTGSTDDAPEESPADELGRRQDRHNDDDCPPPLSFLSPPWVSLILPCPDGAFPYLTPHMLRQCFPARHYPHLVLGIAVRDTCVVPAATSHRKEGEDGDTKKEPTPNGGLAGTKRTTNPRTAKKGHAFASASYHGGGSKTLVDPWLLEYRRTIVPTFDLWDDGHYGKGNSPNGSGGSQAATNGPKGKGGNSKSASRGGGGGAPPSFSATALPAVSSNDKIWLKTPQGRLPLSADAYMDAALHLTRCGLGKSSEYVVPLFDAIPPPPPTTTTPLTAKMTSSTRTATTTATATTASSHPSTAVASAKRKALAVQRCQNWHRQCVQHIHDAARRRPQGGGSSVVRVLAPVVLDPTHRPSAPTSRADYGENSRGQVDDDDDDDADDNEDDDLLLRQLRDQRADDSDEAEFDGSVLIGWHALDAVQRRHALQRWQEHRRHHHAAQPDALIPAHPDGDGNGIEKKERGAAAVVVVLKTRTLMQFLDAALLERGAIARSGVLVACDLPAVWSRNHKAFVLRLPPPSRPSQGDRNPPVTASSRAPEKTRTEAAMGDSRSPKRPRLDPNSECDQDKNGGNAKQGLLDENGCVNVSPHCDGIDDGDVSRHPWFRDASPVIRGCPCATCRHHTRAYIYHLVCAKELLGEVLLFVHNLHHILALVDRINQDNVSTSDSFTINEYITEQLPPTAAKERGGKVLRN
jgi:Queuine tRNA-ribosyltransferase